MKTIIPYSYWRWRYLKEIRSVRDGFLCGSGSIKQMQSWLAGLRQTHYGWQRLTKFFLNCQHGEEFDSPFCFSETMALANSLNTPLQYLHGKRFKVI